MVAGSVCKFDPKHWLKHLFFFYKRISEHRHISQTLLSVSYTRNHRLLLMKCKQDVYTVVVYQLACWQVEGRGAPNVCYSILQNFECHM